MATTTKTKSGGSVLGALGSAFGSMAGSYGRALTGAAGTVGPAAMGALGTTASAAYSGLPQISYGPSGGTQPTAARTGGGAGAGSYFGQRMLPPAGGEVSSPAYGTMAGGGGQGVIPGRGISGIVADWKARAGERQRQQQMKDWYGRWGKEQATAKAANEARYQQMLNIAAKTTGQREMDIRADYAGREASGMQQLARQGMAGTTIAPTMGMGYEREQSAALDRLADLMQGTKLGIIERRQDAYPDLGAYMAAGQMMGPRSV